MTNNFNQKNKMYVIPAVEPESRFSNRWILNRVQDDKRASFTLIELLVVLALVAILSVVVVMTLNPAELIKQARDSNRLSDLSTINTALNLFSADVTAGFIGTSTVVYVSIPSASPACVGLGLPTLPAGWNYNCVTTANLRNTNGTGWIPVNFQRISSNSPISQLPVDPINTTSTRLYYTYVSGGSWELNASIEAAKNKLGGSGDLVSKDGGSATSQYEIGNNLSLNPLETGDSSLVGYWNFENEVLDHSGYGNNGIWVGTSTPGYATGKVGVRAGIFSGISYGAAANIYLNAGTSTLLQSSGDFTFSVWQNKTQTITDAPAGLVSNLTNVSGNYYGISLSRAESSVSVYVGSGVGGYAVAYPAISSENNRWINIVLTTASGSYYVYVDGNKIIGPVPLTLSYSPTNFAIGQWGPWLSAYSFPGLIDDVRVYNRALSAAEVLALYNATK